MAYRRFLSRVPELQKRTDGQTVVAGYAAVFYKPGDSGTEFHLVDRYYERFLPGCFDEAIRDDDVRSFVDHETRCILGRRGAGTLRLAVDDVGLRYEVTLGNQSYARDLVEALERGDVTGSSIQFLLGRKRGAVAWVADGDREIREIRNCELISTDPVSIPAYESTTAFLRSIDPERLAAEAKAFLASQASLETEIDVRLRALAVDGL